MARYSPRDPGYTRSPGILEGLAHIARQGAQGFTASRAEEERQEDRDLERELLELELHESGYRRGRAPQEEVPEEEDIFAGQLPGLVADRPSPGRPRGAGPGTIQERSEAAPPLFRGALPGSRMAAAGRQGPSGLETGLAGIEQQGLPPEPAEPQVVAVPGAFVEGMGFTPRAITDQDLVAHTRAGAARPRERTRPGFEQVTEDRYLDHSATFAGREAARETEEQQASRAMLERGLAAMQEGRELSPEEMADLLEAGLPASHVLPGTDEDVIRMDGHPFPNTDAGERAALAWRAAAREAGRVGARDTGDGRVTGEVTRRQVAMAAARALLDIDGEMRDLSQRERERLPVGYYESQVSQVLSILGFDNVQDLEEEMRILRLEGVGDRPVGGDGGPGTGAPSEYSDEELDAAIEQAGPGASPEEVLSILEGNR